MRPKRRKAKPMGVRKQRRTYPAHVQWVRGHDCAIANGECSERVEAHHVREMWQPAMGEKPPDYCTVPLCSRHHAQLHTKGRLTFQRIHGGIDLINLAEFLARTSPHKYWEDHP